MSPTTGPTGGADEVKADKGNKRVIQTLINDLRTGMTIVMDSPPGHTVQHVVGRLRKRGSIPQWVNIQVTQNGKRINNDLSIEEVTTQGAQLVATMGQQGLKGGADGGHSYKEQGKTGRRAPIQEDPTIAANASPQGKDPMEEDNDSQEEEVQESVPWEEEMGHPNRISKSASALTPPLSPAHAPEEEGMNPMNLMDDTPPQGTPDQVHITQTAWLTQKRADMIVMESNITGGQGTWVSLDPDTGTDPIPRTRLNNHLLQWGPIHAKDGETAHRMVEINARMNTIRVITYTRESLITVRYFTRRQVWTAQVDRAMNDTWEWVGATPVPQDIKPILSEYIQDQTDYNDDFEIRMEIARAILAGDDAQMKKMALYEGQDRMKMDVHTQTSETQNQKHDKGGTITHRTCPACGESGHSTRWWIGALFPNKINVTCAKARKRGGRQMSVHTPDECRKYLFPISHPDYKFQNHATEKKRNREECREEEGQDNNSPNNKKRDKDDKHKHHRSGKKHDIVIRSWNIDGLTNKTQDVSAIRLSAMFRQADKDKVDILTLQEAGGLAMSHAKLLQMGWIIHEHKNVAILISVHTVQTIMAPTKIWKGKLHGKDIDAMSITIETPEGPMIILNAYVPSGVDRMPRRDENDKEKQDGTPETQEEIKKREADLKRFKGWDRDKVAEMHGVIFTHITTAALAVICMDANETTCIMGRRMMKAVHDGKLKPTYSGNSKKDTTMDVYQDTMINAHELKNEALYMGEGVHEDTYTHETVVQGERYHSESRIDYT